MGSKCNVSYRGIAHLGRAGTSQCGPLPGCMGQYITVWATTWVGEYITVWATTWVGLVHHNVDHYLGRVGTSQCGPLPGWGSTSQCGPLPGWGSTSQCGPLPG